MSYKSYSKTIRKLATAWEQNQETAADIIKDVKEIDVGYFSVNDIKELRNYTLADNYEMNGNIYNPGDQFVARFANLPEELISSAFLSFTWSFFHTKNSTGTTYDITKAYADYNAASTAGTLGKLKVGDIYIQSMHHNSFWTKISQTGWKFHFQPFIQIYEVTQVTNGGINGWSASLITIFLTANLVFLGERTHHAIQSGK